MHASTFWGVRSSFRPCRTYIIFPRPPPRSPSLAPRHAGSMEPSHALGAPTGGPAAGHVVTDHDEGLPISTRLGYKVRGDRIFV